MTSSLHQNPTQRCINFLWICKNFPPPIFGGSVERFYCESRSSSEMKWVHLSMRTLTASTTSRSGASAPVDSTETEWGRGRRGEGEVTERERKWRRNMEKWERSLMRGWWCVVCVLTYEMFSDTRQSHTVLQLLVTQHLSTAGVQTWVCHPRPLLT